MRFHFVLLLLLPFTSVFAIDINTSKTEWTATTGSKIHGKLISVDSDILKFKKADDSVISIPQSLLIEADIDFIKTLLKAKQKKQTKRLNKKNKIKIWTSTSGAEIKAAFISYDSGIVKLKKENGEIISLPDNLLISENIETIKKNVFQAAIKKPKEIVVANLQTWETVNGTKIEAAAVSLIDKQLKLQTADGSFTILPIDLVSNASLATLEAMPELTRSSNSAELMQKDNYGSTIDLPYKLGSTNKVEAERDFWVNIYVPSSLRAGEKYSCLIFIEPKQGSNRFLNSLKKAADENEMIILTMDRLNIDRHDGNHRWYSRVPRTTNTPIINETYLAGYISDGLDKLKRDFPIDQKRIYVAGAGETCHVALWAQKTIGAAGFLAYNGGGKGINSIANRDMHVAMCKASSKSRHDLASTFKPAEGKSLSNLMFINNNNIEENFSEGIRTLNGSFLLKHQAGLYEQRSLRYETQLVEYITNLADSSPQKAIPWIDFTKKYGLKNNENTEVIDQLLKKVMQDPLAFKSFGGFETCSDLLLKHYDKGWSSFKDGHKSSVQNSITTIAKKYEGTIWHSVLIDLANDHVDRR